jgi:DNA-binding MurR/RpiR family transcriptional regulator
MNIEKNIILETLMRDLESYPRSVKKVAMYVIDHPSEFGMGAVRDTAKLAGVSTNSLVRLANLLGFESFQQLREPFRQALTSQAADADSDRWIEDLYARGGAARTKANVASSLIGNVVQSIRQTNPELIEQAAKTILSANKVYLLGTRAPYGLVHFFYYVGRMALSNLDIAPRHANSPIDELLHIDEGDVVFAISTVPFSRDTIEACQWARKRGAKLILLSDSAAESLPLRADISIIVPVATAMHFPSFVGVQAVLEWLLVEIGEQGGEEIQNRIESFQQMRDQASVYWSENKTKVMF